MLTDWAGVRLLVDNAGLEAESLHFDSGPLFRVQVLENLGQDGKELLAVLLLREKLAVQLQILEEFGQSDQGRLVLGLKM